jgi:hypothetical protein
LPVSRRLHPAPLAVASGGAVLLNVARFDDVVSMEEVLALAREMPGAVFIGVALSADELRRLRDLLDDASLQAAFALIAIRQRAAHR